MKSIIFIFLGLLSFTVKAEPIIQPKYPVGGTVFFKKEINRDEANIQCTRDMTSCSLVVNKDAHSKKITKIETPIMTYNSGNGEYYIPPETDISVNNEFYLSKKLLESLEGGAPGTIPPVPSGALGIFITGPLDIVSMIFVKSYNKLFSEVGCAREALSFVVNHKNLNSELEVNSECFNTLATQIESAN